jgi:hypothetical protein
MPQEEEKLFVGRNDYPTSKVLCAFVADKRPELALRVEDDVIRIHAPDRC